jgi:hypothetical protein
LSARSTAISGTSCRAGNRGSVVYWAARWLELELGMGLEGIFHGYL